MRKGIETVLVVGRDLDAWLTALCLSRAFGPTGLTVKILELPSRIGDNDVISTLPTFQGLHKLIGIDEADIIRAAQGVPTLGQRFSNWSASAPSFMHAFDAHGAAYNGLEFFQYWLSAQQAGMNVSLEDFSFGAVAAKQGKFLSPEQNGLDFSQASYGYHLDAGSYTRAVASLALRQGVQPVKAQYVGTVVEDGRIAGIQLSDDSLVEADLYIDASGADANLIREIPGDNFDDWTRWLPCNRQIVASAPRLNPLPAFAEALACNAGWVGLFPLLDRTAVVASYNSSIMPDDRMLEAIPVLTGLSLQGEATVSRMRAGRRQPWQGNCISIGASAAGLDMLDGAQAHLLHTGISSLISMFPLDVNAMVEAVDYNQAIKGHAENLRDFQISHFHLNRRYDETFWNAARDMQPPLSLQQRLAFFRARGRVLTNDNETYLEDDWFAILVGHGVMPVSCDLRSRGIDPAEHMQFFQGLLKSIAQETQQLPGLETHMEFYSSNRAPVSPGSFQGGFDAG